MICVGGGCSIDSTSQEGQLAGWTILRYSQSHDSGGGGVETHLAELNRALCHSNRLTTIEIGLTSDPGRVGEREDALGQSRLVDVRLLGPSPDQFREDAPSSAHQRLVVALLDAAFPTPALNALATRTLFRSRRVPWRTGEPRRAGERAAEVFDRRKVDLVVLHKAGGAASSAVLAEAEARGIPVVLVHHFSNHVLGGLSARQQVARVRGVGAASRIAVPRYLRGRLWNLSDAVDTTFFDPRRLKRPSGLPDGPILYAPARIAPDKGQADVLRVAEILRRRGVPVRVRLAGRVDVPAYADELREMVRREELQGVVEFLGPLTMEAYRDGYAGASLLLLPTVHQEGMPRTLLDAQAMGVPPLVYEAGGVREGVRDGETGFVLPPGDVEGMARVAEALLRDPARRLAVAQAGREFVETHFQPRNLAARHTAFYLAAVARAVGRPALARPAADEA